MQYNRWCVMMGVFRVSKSTICMSSVLSSFKEHTSEQIVEERNVLRKNEFQTMPSRIGAQDTIVISNRALSKKGDITAMLL